MFRNTALHRVEHLTPGLILACEIIESESEDPSQTRWGPSKPSQGLPVAHALGLGTARATIKTLWHARTPT